MVDEQEGCEWMNVSSGTGSPGQTRTKGRKTAVCVCVCVHYHEKIATNITVTSFDIVSLGVRNEWGPEFSWKIFPAGQFAQFHGFPHGNCRILWRIAASL